MVYYQVKESSDQTPVYKKISSGHWMQARVLIANELYTRNEIIKMMDKYNLSSNFLLTHFRPYSIEKHRTYWSFGCRFPMKNFEGKEV